MADITPQWPRFRLTLTTRETTVGANHTWSLTLNAIGLACLLSEAYRYVHTRAQSEWTRKGNMPWPASAERLSQDSRR
ncbi:hypothetical protein SCLCIDRAFT_1134363 [Scleroderma citrinum Foug A]|uniref:Uncharacterized protein n=1 Tax=Scleroderma citrinum Foug A TaxID=1036808 RepID=A0A0C3DMY5_9AGAM|nr:hypothetical protein SCLCIDRAFT_1134363 [Scleroderma citrinum Foug A]